jgi:hypothetical protein
MRFVAVLAEIIGNLSMPAPGLQQANVDIGNPVYLAIGEMLLASMRALPVTDHLRQRASTVAVKAAMWATSRVHPAA